METHNPCHPAILNGLTTTKLRLARTPEAGDYELCFDAVCHALSEWLGPPRRDRPWVELWSCRMRDSSQRN